MHLPSMDLKRQRFPIRPFARAAFRWEYLNKAPQNMDFTMMRPILATAAFIVAVTSGTAYAQTLTPGFDPSSPLPSVSLPQRVTTTAARPAAPAEQPKQSTSITRNGGTATVSDRTKAPEGSLKAASGGNSPATPTTATVATSQSKYTSGMVLYGSAKAYDGHSMLVDGNPVRLNGIEAPGLKQTCSTAKGTAWKCGQKAYERLSALVGSGKVRCVVDSPAGHGAAVTCSGARTKDIAELLVSEGLAVPNEHSGGKYTAAARSAMAAKRGIWMGPFKDPAKWRIANR